MAASPPAANLDPVESLQGQIAGRLTPRSPSARGGRRSAPGAPDGLCRCPPGPFALPGLRDLLLSHARQVQGGRLADVVLRAVEVHAHQAVAQPGETAELQGLPIDAIAMTGRAVTAVPCSAGAMFVRQVAGCGGQTPASSPARLDWPDRPPNAARGGGQADTARNGTARRTTIAASCPR